VTRRFLVALLLGSSLQGAAEEAIVRAELDARRVGVQDQLQLTLTLEGDAVRLLEEVTTPPLLNLRVAGGPFLSTRVSLVNGAMSQQRIYTWVLQPTAPGKAEVGAFSVKLAGGEKSTAPIPVEVVAGSVRPRAQQRADPFDREPFGGEDPFESLFGRGRQGGARRPAPKLFMEAAPSRTRVHVGEPLLLTYYVYTQTSISDIQFSDAPQYPGFWSEDLERGKTSPQGEAATVEGEAYRRFPIFQRLLFPTRAGQLSIPAATLKIGIPRQSFFDPGAQAVERATKPVTITVDPIPDEPGFSGAVGRFRASASLDKASLPLGEAATLRFRVEGSGNLKWIDKAPEIKVPGAKVYPPTTSSDLRASASGISGSKTWEFVVVPETTGALEVPALAFAYFEPGAGRIQRAETAPIPIRVEGAAAGPSVPLPGPAPGLGRGRSGPLPLRTELDLPARLPVVQARTVTLGLGLVLLLHGALWGGPLLADRLRAAQGRPAPRRHVRAAVADIQRAGRDRMSKEAAAALLEKALHEVFGAVDETAASQDGDRERAARAVLQEVQFIRYAPQLGDYSEKIREVAARAADVVRKWA
jgi:hypothetical protein